MPTAAAIIIGNEILTGKFSDENGPWLAQQLREIGVDLVRITVIPDDLEVIAHTVREFSNLATHVFTSGGIGPTHDDVTFQGVAMAFDVPIRRNKAMAQAIKKRMADSFTPEALKMADLPDGTILFGEGLPVFVCRNVVMFPGVPRYFRDKFRAFSQMLEGTPVQTRRLKTTAREASIASTLTEAASRWPDVDIGSYPRVEEQPPTVIVTIDSRDSEALRSAHEWLENQLAPGA